MKKTLLVLVILCIYHFLDFGRFWHVSGQFNIGDFGLLLILASILIFSFMKGLAHYRTIFSLLIIFYAFFILFQIFLCVLNFNQSYLDGLIASRMQYAYFSFFLFVFCLEETEDIEKFLNFLTYIALAALALGIINIFVPGVLSHYTQEKAVYRYGILRVYLPAMPLISFSAIWEISKLSQRKDKSPIVYALILLGAHFIRMTRMRIIGVIAVFFFTLASKKRVIEIAIIGIILFISSVVLIGFFQEDIITGSFKSAYEDLSGNTGTWGSRVAQTKFAFQEFLKNPLWGNGNASLRNSIYQNNRYLFALSYKADLGYMAWLKAYGLVGIIWLSLLFGACFFYLKKIKLTQKNSTIATFAKNYLIFIIGTAITLNHFMYEQGIILLCIILACIYRLHLIQTKEKVNENQQYHSKL